MFKGAIIFAVGAGCGLVVGTVSGVIIGIAICEGSTIETETVRTPMDPHLPDYTKDTV